MVKRSTLLLIVIVAIIMVLGVGFAAITSTRLDITGNTTANPSQENFIVKFLSETEVSDPGKATAIVTGDTTATIAVQGLSAKGDTVTATYRVKNMSQDLSADLVLGIGNNNEEYFRVTADLGKESLVAGEETTVVVTVELVKTLITTNERAQMEVQIIATPVQPGEEGTSNVPPPEVSIPDPEPVSPSEIYDAEGTNPNGLHIGDFVNYDAGTWTEEEINAIQTGLKTSLVTANGSTSLPNTAFQFGGFTAGASRNGNATPFDTTYNYVKDAGTGEAITGWRVFDIEGDTVTLISAGNPEDYYHPYGTNYAYISEYILTGNINSSWSSGGTDSANYQIRNWSNYVNTAQKAESATVLTKSRLDDWYTKYTDTPNANTFTRSTFQKIYDDSAYYKYQNMVDNYSHYWLSAANNSDYVSYVIPGYRCAPQQRLCVWRARPSFSNI